MTALQDPEPDTTMEELAALDFAPWSHQPEGWQPPTNNEWTCLANPHLISVRLAWLTLHKSKTDLIEMASERGDDAIMELVEQIGRSADWFEGLHNLIASAECRIISAIAARSMSDAGGQ